MTPLEYQQLAQRTQCPQPHVIRPTLGPIKSEVLHGCLGIASEGGELLAEMQRWLWYNKGLSILNIFEELGDVLWYVAEVCNAMGWRMEDVMTANIAKLKQRYPNKYTDYNAAEANRDRAAEAQSLAKSERLRTKQVVLESRKTPIGCCEDYANNQRCTCLEDAI